MKRRVPAIWLTACALLGPWQIGGCSPKSAPAPKPPKSSEAVLQAVGSRQALNSFRSILEQCFAIPLQSFSSPQERAAQLVQIGRKAELTGLPPDLQADFRGMLQVWEEVARGAGPPSPPCVTRGNAAAQTLNASLLRHGLTGYRF